MCYSPTPYALDPDWWGLRGRKLGLCGGCFNDDNRLHHAVSFARALWRHST